MPRVIRCEGCQQSHLIRDQFVGCRVRCDCGRLHTVPSTAPSVASPTGWLDVPIVQLGSIGMLLLSVLVFGGVIAWVAGLDAAPESPKPPTTTQPDPSTTQPAPAPPDAEDPTRTTPKPRPVDPRLLALRKQLQDDDVETRTRAIKELKDLEDDSLKRQAIPDVVAAAKQQTDEDFLEAAATCLEAIGPPLKKDYSCLKEALQVAHPLMRRYAMSALKNLGDKAGDAMDVLVEALKHRDPEVHREAAALMKKLGAPAHAPALRLLLNPSSDADEEASLEVLKTLLSDEKPLTVEEIGVLAETLRDAKRRIRMRCFAVDNLGKGEQFAGAVPALLDVLREKSDDKLLVRSLEALSRIGDRRKDVLTQLLAVVASDRDEKIRLQALQLSGQLDSSALSAPQLLERWTAEDSSIVRQELDRMLHARLTQLRRDRMKELLPLLRHKETEIVLVGLKVVQDRKEEAADVAEAVAGLLAHDNAGVREASLVALEALGSAVEKTLPRLSQQLLDHCSTEKEPAVRKALTKTLRSRMELLRREQMKELLPLLRHKETEIVLVGLKVVQTRKEEAVDVSEEVAGLLAHGDAEVREATLIALEALGSAVEKTLPRLSQQLLDHYPTEKNATVRDVLLRTLQSRMELLKQEQMKELLPLLRHKETEIVLVGLQVVRTRKEEAADVAEEVAGLLQAQSPRKVRETALTTLKALGPSGKKALPKLFKLLDEAPRFERTALALTVAGMLESRDATNAERLVPFLLEGLHPEAEKDRRKPAEAVIKQTLANIGQPAVEASLKALYANLELPRWNSKDNSRYRIKLYENLADMGRKYRSRSNYESLEVLWRVESRKKYNTDVATAANKAMRAMEKPD